MDKAQGLFFHPAKMHMLHHKGEHFSVRGPLMAPRSPQGQPVIVQAGQSEAGRDLAARTAEVLFTVQQQLAPAQAFYADLKARVARCGRAPDSLKIMPGVVTVVGRTRDEAQEKFDSLQALIHPQLGVAALSDIVGLDPRRSRSTAHCRTCRCRTRSRAARRWWSRWRGLRTSPSAS